jgi:hypothetical protein
MVIFGCIVQGRNASCDPGCTVILAKDDTTLSLNLQLSVLNLVKYSATSLVNVNWGHQVSGIVASPTVTYGQEQIQFPRHCVLFLNTRRLAKYINLLIYRCQNYLEMTDVVRVESRDSLVIYYHIFL